VTYDVEEYFELFVDPIFDVESTTDQTHLMLRVLGRQKPTARFLLVHVHVVAVHLQSINQSINQSEFFKVAQVIGQGLLLDPLQRDKLEYSPENDLV